MDSGAAVLLIDDDVDLCHMLTEYLGRYGFAVVSAHRGDVGVEKVRHGRWSIVLLDVMLPGIDGFEVLKQIRTFSSISVLLLTARGDEIDRIVGLEIGADDYVAKPFNARELLARMRAVLRRASAASSPGTANLLSRGDLILDPATRTVTQAGREVGLTDIEFALLETLMQRSGVVIERDELAKAVLGRPLNPFDRSLDMHVSRLRRKLAAPGQKVEVVQTIRGSGYRLIPPSAEPGGRS